MIIVMVINLYAVRLVLNALGTIDYGIYTVVAGIITMLSCITSVLMTATQRYYSFALGKKDTDSLNKIFSTSVYISLLGSILILLIGETIGLWFVNNQLVIPTDRIPATNWLYQATIVSFISVFLQMPFGSAIIAHEKMGYFALITTIEAILKLGVALLININSAADRLILYGILLSIISIISLLSYIIIATNKFQECHFHKVKDKRFFKELLSFSGWNFIGSLAGVGLHYVNTILVNIFFGPIANAAQAIAFQISSALNTFSGSFIMALKPPMIKSYAEHQYEELNKLFGIGNKFVYYCMLIVSIPLILEMKTVIRLWLGIDNDQTVLFSRLIVIYTFILVLNNPISIIMQATGYVKQYFIAVESVTLFCPILIFILFEVGLPAYYSFIAMIICVSCSHIIRLIILQRFYKGARIYDYYYFIIRAIAVTICTLLPILFLKTIIVPGFLRLVILIITTVIITSFFVYFIGISKNERRYINQLALKLLNKDSWKNNTL